MYSSKGNDILYYYVILLKVDYSLLRKSPWKWSLVNRWKKSGMLKINNGFYIKLSIHLLYITNICK